MEGSCLRERTERKEAMNSYLKSAFNELFAEDGLTVMGRGLGLSNLFAKFAQYYADQEQTRRLVLCLNCAGVEEQLVSVCTSCPDSMIGAVPEIINNEMPAIDRVERYSRGGCYIITSRILIVDLLDGKVDPVSLSGILVYNAHSLLSFEYFERKNRLGFIKAFSEEPEALQSGFGKVERLMRTLFVKKLFLWPRFRLEVVESLKKSGEPEVIELVTNLSPNMKAIQSAILAAMNSCIQELKKASPNLETSHMTLENGLFQAFDVTIKSQLESEWHRTPQRTKQLVTDVATLRKLLDYLVRYDAFAFYYLLMKLQQASTDQQSPSLWLTSEAANQVFKKAKERVFRLIAVPAAAGSSSGKATAGVPALEADRAAMRAQLARKYGLPFLLQPSSECPPKWKLAVDAMNEIRADYLSKTKQPTPAASEESAHDRMHRLSSQGRVLFIVKDSMAQAQLRDVLVAGIAPVCDRRYRWYVSQQAAEVRARARKQQQQGGFRREGGGKRASSETVGEPPAKSARTEEDSRRAFLYPTESELMDTTGGVSAAQSTCIEAGDGFLFGMSPASFSSLSVESKSLVIEEHCLRASSIAMDLGHAPDGTAQPGGAHTSSGSVGVLDPDLHVMLMTHAEAKENFCSMQDCSPAYVVLYDPDISIIRTIEAYQSTITAHAPPVKVYFLLYEGSGEEHRYAGALFKEKKAFESLISAKEHMVISLPDHPADVQQEAQAGGVLSLDTRTSTRPANKGKRGVVVDVRDFRCSLPSALYVSGKFNVVPRTLQVGDYVLSPEICVERKGISDLFQSFASGRLYNQAEAMMRHYKYPCLLIEFAQDKAFCLMAANEMSPDILQHAITSRIALLALSFPNLRVLWSRSPACTVDIFRSLINNHEEVDVVKAVSAGSPFEDEADRDRDRGGDALDGEGAGEGEGSRAVRVAAAQTQRSRSARPGGGADMAEDSTRASAQELLLSLPGVNVHNYRDVMAAVSDLAELSTLSVEQLTPLVGPVNAKKLYAFFWQSA